MWDKIKSSRFQELRRFEQEHLLFEAEEIELRGMISELEAVEATYLAPATQRISEERESLEKQNNALRELVIRKEAMAERLSNLLSEARATRRAID